MTAIDIHAASAVGRGTSSGQAAPSGQLSENQRMARSKLPVVRSPPASIRANVFPSPNTRVEMPERVILPSRPLVLIADAYRWAT